MIRRTRGVGLVGRVVVAVGADGDGHGHNDEELAEHGCVCGVGWWAKVCLWMHAVAGRGFM